MERTFNDVLKIKSKTEKIKGWGAFFFFVFFFFFSLKLVTFYKISQIMEKKNNKKCERLNNSLKKIYI